MRGTTDRSVLNTTEHELAGLPKLAKSAKAVWRIPFADLGKYATRKDVEVEEQDKGGDAGTWRTMNLQAGGEDVPVDRRRRPSS